MHFTRNQGHTGVNKLGIMYRNVILTTKPFYDSIIESNSDSVVISVKKCIEIIFKNKRQGCALKFCFKIHEFAH